MKTSIILPIAVLLLSFTMSNAQEAPLPSDLKKKISEWRTNSLPTLPPEEYWSELKDLGSKVGEVNARRIETSESIDTDSAIALMAYRVWQDNGKVAELSSWYGRRVNEITPETWEQMKTKLNNKGLSHIEIYRELAHGWTPEQRGMPPVMPIIASQHKQEEFLPAWEAWMLSPHSPERQVMRQRMNEALSAIGDGRTIAILTQKTRILPKHVIDSLDPKSRQNEPDEIRWTIRSIGGKAAVLGLLECVQIAEAQGYSGEGHDSIRNLVIYLLASSYNPRELEANPEWAATLLLPGKVLGSPGPIKPADDKWKEFKPIIEEMLKTPKDLRAEDISLLKDILAAMPKN